MMRSFDDRDGKVWEVSIGRESWGTIVLLFIPRGKGEVRKHMLAVESVLEGEQQLDAASDAELREHLAASQPWG